MDQFSLQNPVFATYVIAATVMILKAVGMSWLTVVRMTEVKGGYRSPEDIRKTRLNPEPNPSQLLPNERVERIRRIQLNDLENLPFFLVAGLLFVLTAPSLLLAQWLLYGYVVSRLLHFAAYFTAQTHDMRATLWTVGSLILIFITCRTLAAALDTDGAGNSIRSCRNCSLRGASRPSNSTLIEIIQISSPNVSSWAL
jgi:glutathione S-transferase